MHLTLQEVRKAFENGGVSVSDWAETHGFRRENVYAVLSGRTRGLRGQAHQIAAALGLKQEVDLAAALAESKAVHCESSSPAITESPMS